MNLENINLFKLGCDAWNACFVIDKQDDKEPATIRIFTVQDPGVVVVAK